MSSSNNVLTHTEDLQSSLPLIAHGKIRDLYALSPTTLLFTTTDRISAFDIILPTGIPHKGRLLTLLSTHWFTILTTSIPSLRTHFLTLTLPPQIPPSLQKTYQNRSIQVHKYPIFPIEAIVRGYISGSAWKSYRQTRTVCGIPFPEGLQESQAFPDGPIYTPSTKAAEYGDHDENIHPDRAAEIVGSKYAQRIEELSLAIYKCAAAYALERGIIIADTKFEFGLDEERDEVVLVDEVLTPDSSRFWAVEGFEVGRAPRSFDKQFLRDWLVGEGLDGKEGVEVPGEVVRKTEGMYREAFERLTGRRWEEVLP
ncbi:MAG: hypothetical protein Q9186_000270 [Xanthomendoza sp. 1 TL-2023]